MTTKEKAKQLVEKFRISKAITESYGKQCSLIAVDLLIDQCEKYKLFSQEVYWIDVRKELENF